MGLYLARHDELGSTITMLGTIFSGEVNCIGVEYFGHERFKQMNYSIWDLSEAVFPDFVPGQNPDMFKAAVEAALDNPHHKICLVASNPAVRELCTALTALDKIQTLPWNLKLFGSLAEARAWVEQAA